VDCALAATAVNSPTQLAAVPTKRFRIVSFPHVLAASDAAFVGNVVYFRIICKPNIPCGIAA
jgi:hypothetical protein